jgi:hypothetical protein
MGYSFCVMNERQAKILPFHGTPPLGGVFYCMEKTVQIIDWKIISYDYYWQS